MALTWPWKRLTAAAAPPGVQPAAPVAPGIASAPAGELGITGTTNWMGALRVDENERLSHQSAFGIAGAIRWGEWERLAKTDPHIAMALDFVCAPIRDATWAIEPDEDSPESVKHAEFVTWNLAEYLEPGFDELKAAAAWGMLSSGFSLFERVYDVGPCDLLPGGQGHLLKKLAERLPSSVHPNGWIEGPSLDLEKVHQLGPSNDGSSRYRDVLIPSSKLLLFSWKRSGNNYQGVSAFRAVYYLARIREMLAKLIGISMQRESAGLPVATAADAKANLTDDQRRDLQQLLSNLVLHENAAAVLPAGWDLEWVYSPGANKGHVLDVYNGLGLTILEQLQAQQMVLGTSNTGSRAVGEVHASASLSYVQGVVATLESVFNGVGRRQYTGVIKQMIDVNFGPQESYPKLNITLKKPQMNPVDRATATAAAIAAGLFTVTAIDENVLREDLGYAPIDEEEREKLHAEKAAQAAAIAGTGEPDGDEDKDGKEPPGPEEKKPPKKPFTASRLTAAFTPSRPLRDSEKVLATQEIADYLDTARAAFEKEARPVVVEMLVRAQPAIHAAMADGDPSEVATIPLDTTRLRKVIGEFLARSRAEGARQVRGELAHAKVCKAAAKLTAASGEGDEKDPVDETITSDTDDLLDAQERALTRRMESRLRSELETEALEAIRTGDDAGEVVTRTVTRQLDSSAFRSDAGTVVTRAWNLGRDEAARLMNATEVEYSAIMDNATCGPCADMDGQTAPVGSAEHDAMLPPNRDCEGAGNCRCLCVYVPSEDGDEGDGEDDAPDDTTDEGDTE